ncbi:MAG: glycosyltransferase family 4 protein [Armatimonadota bacterium]|nr:glycosyltransferase family 4 protein [Armatimonadota bacterium]MDR7479487.1 glycosyltransferase family 4 protein [Armatimonadota bacterium]MDR7526650.1 glycosyltransferase family 4 protein [Armatimonadota bacterium]MDR7543915.1 glycosyltransferase family 4 protein [Armatimonadota bacterium]MDR7573965.1 glycosyltransferase family 4 protein [Armatimonadota bacterium]
MRVAILAEYLIGRGGETRQLLMLARTLQHLGWKATVYTYLYAPDSCFPEICKDLEIVSLKRVQAGNGESRPSRVLLGAGVRDKLTRLARAFLWRSRLSQLLPANVRILNPHGLFVEPAVVLAARRLRVPIVWMCNDPLTRFQRHEEPTPVSALYLRYHRRFVSKVAEIAVLDQQSAQIVARLYGRSAAIVRSGVEWQKLATPLAIDFADDAVRRWLDGRFRCLSLGVAYPHRRFEDAIRAVAQVRAHGVDISYLIAGTFVYAPQYKRMLQEVAKQLGVADHIHFLDRLLDERELIALYQLASVFVFPNERQTWGLGPLEAMAAGTPAVVSTGAGVAEVLTEDETALLFPPRAPGELARQLRKVAEDDMLRLRLARAGQRFVQMTFSWEKYARQMIDIFGRALGASDRTAHGPSLTLD